FNMSAKTIGLISILIFAIVNIFTPQLVQVFMDKGANEELYAYSIKAIRMFSLSFIIVGYNILISGFFAAIAKPKYATIISISRGLVIITLVLFIMTAAFGENGIWLATVVSEGISVIASIFIFKNNRYNEQELSELTQ
ncbi:Na+ driven multidrug efflux pump, partial [Clostridium tetanomorphum DSM 665]